jgi:hypothetical protein
MNIHTSNKMMVTQVLSIIAGVARSDSFCVAMICIACPPWRRNRAELSRGGQFFHQRLAQREASVHASRDFTIANTW